MALSSVTPLGHMTTIIAGLFMLLLVVFPAQSDDGILLSERLLLLQEAYRDHIAKVTKRSIVFQNGGVIAIDDGRWKTHQQKLAHADIEDMLSQVYPIAACAGLKAEPERNEDPGRIRSSNFLKLIYGNNRRSVEKNLITIDWFGSRANVTRINGVDRKLRAVRLELKRLGPRFLRFLRKSGGSYNWRPIAGTSRLSAHSFGIAIDINPTLGHYWRWSGGSSQTPQYKNSIPVEIVQAFEKHGFIWGGQWYHYDTMHFEYRPELIAIGKLAAMRGCLRN